MSEPRKDIRAKLDPDMHAALTVLAESDEIDICEFIERELVKVIRARCHAASVIAEKLGRLGLSGNGGGRAGRSRE